MAMIKREVIADYIMKMLGYPTVGVELDPAQIDQAITTAIDEYLATGAVERGYDADHQGKGGNRDESALPPRERTA